MTDSPDTDDAAPQASATARARVRARLRALFPNHRAALAVTQITAIVVAGVWIGLVWLYDNWAVRYLEEPFATLNVTVAEAGQLDADHNYLKLRVEVGNESARRLFNYANAITVRAVAFENRAPPTDLKEIATQIGETRGRAWVFDRFATRDTDTVVAYAQFMSQGYWLAASQDFVTELLVAVPQDVVAVEVWGRFTFGVSDSWLRPRERPRGGLALNDRSELVACSRHLDRRQDYATPCEQSYDADDLRQIEAEALAERRAEARESGRRLRGEDAKLFVHPPYTVKSIYSQTAHVFEPTAPLPPEGD